MTEPFRLLCMCTANRCRSPMAEAMARRMLAERGVDAEVVSAGVMEGGAPATGGSISAMGRRELDLSEHRSHQLDAETTAAADLILTMERRHLTTVAELDVEAVHRAFPLKELAELAPTVGWRPPGLTVQEWIRRADATRTPGAVLSASTGSDVADPMGGPRRAYRQTADEIEALLEVVISALFPPR